MLSVPTLHTPREAAPGPPVEVGRVKAEDVSRLIAPDGERDDGGGLVGGLSGYCPGVGGIGNQDSALLWRRAHVAAVGQRFSAAGDLALS